MELQKKSNTSPWQRKLHEIIFEADTRAGKWFDITLLILIILSVAAVMLESVPSIDLLYGEELRILEWIFTILFTLEYIARLVSTGKPLKYVFSFYGIIDFVSIMPTYLGIFITGTHTLSIIRSIRLLRVFRIMKLARFIGEADVLIKALKASRAKIVVFLFAVLSLTFILGTLMYLIESPESGFTSIPRSIYWAIVTLTTVGYGDITPDTVLGQTLASFIMIIGYGIIAVPTGIVSAEYTMVNKKNNNFDKGRSCEDCGADVMRNDADYCRKCGHKLNDD